MIVPAFRSYFVEIRLRCFYLVFSFCLTTLVSYFFSFELIYLFVRPLQAPKSFIFTDLTEALSTTIRICLTTSFCVIIPFTCYQSWSFLIPSFYNSERVKATIFFSFILFLFFFASFIIYFFLFPEICRFFSSFSIKKEGLNIQLEAKILSYVKFVSQFYFFFVMLSQIPFFFYFLFEYKLITSYYLSQLRKSLSIFSVIFAAFLSPPDVVDQVLLAFFLSTFYELVIWFGFYHNSLTASRQNRVPVTCSSTQKVTKSHATRLREVLCSRCAVNRNQANKLCIFFFWLS